MSGGSVGWEERLRRITAEVLYFGVTVALIASLSLIFADSSFMGPLLVNAAITHLIISLLRWLRIPVVSSAILSLLIVCLTQVWIHYPSTTRFGLPWGESVSAIRVDIREALDLIATAEVPLPVSVGMLLMAALATWLIVFLGDWGAFRLGSPQVEVFAPAAAVFIVLSFFGEGTARVLHALGVVAACLAFSVVHPSRRFDPSRRASLHPASSRGLGGALMAAAAVVASLVSTSIAYGQLQESPFDFWTNRASDGGGGTEGRVVPNPLVSVRSQLRELSDVEVFSVQSSEPAYWRMTALETFDGESWSLRTSHYSVENNRRLDNTVLSSAPEMNEVTQNFAIENLASIWLPAAYQPVAVAAEDDREVRFASETSTLLLESDTTYRLAYRVLSETAVYSADYLRGLRNSGLTEVSGELLQVPSSVSPRVRELAWNVTANTNSPYERALVLQNWLRRNYTYSLDIPPGHSGSHLDQFLFEWGEGYCEQFATAFAAMGRVVGLPTRVAVGFTPGEAVEVYPDGGALYLVKGKHAHTWPEVYLGGAGWVAFEPTPGRGAPGADSYTFVPEQQDAPPLPSTTIVEPPPPPEDGSDVFPADPGVEEPSTRPELETASSSWPLWRILVLAAAGVLGFYLLSTATLSVLRNRSLRRRSAEEPALEVLLKWEKVLELLELRGMRRRASETPLEMSRKAAVSLGMPAGPWLALGTAVSQAGFARPDEAEALSDSQRESVEAILAGLQAQLTPGQQIGRIVGFRVWRFRKRA